MLYSEPLFRPPAEAGSLIVQVSEGCPNNHCLFCPMYKGKPFHAKSAAELDRHVRDLQRHFPDAYRRAFLADGDSLAMKTERILSAMARVNAAFPRVQRFGIYGSVFSLSDKSVSDLRELKAVGLRVIYLGIESGDEETLRRMDKFMPATEMIRNCRKVGEAGINLSLMVIVGLGGRDFSMTHIHASASMVNAIAPTHTSLLNLMLEHTVLRKEKMYREFGLDDYLREVAVFVSAIECRTIFRANHASNPILLEGVLPRDRARLLEEIDSFCESKE